MLYVVLERKNNFLGYKKTGSIRQKIDIYPKGLVHGPGPKIAIFLTFFFCQYRREKCVLSYCRTRKRLFWLKKTRRSERQKMDFFPKRLLHGFGPKLAIFPIFFLFANIGQQNVFYHILEGKNAFLGKKKKTRSSENQKIKIFPKGLVRGLGPKLVIFPSYFFRR